VSTRISTFTLAFVTLGACSPNIPVVPMCDVHAAATPTFADNTAAWGLSDVTGNRIVSADLDGDGFPDLLVTAVSSNKRETIGVAPKLVWALMNRPRPDGTGRMFVDATADSGIYQVRGGSTTEFRAAHIAVAADLDNDGDLDIFSGTYVDPTKPMTDPGDRSELLINDGHGHFSLAPPTDARPADGPDGQLPTTSATFTDADRDGKLDLFVGFWYEAYGTSYLGVQAELYRGDGTGGFATNTYQANLLTNDNGFDAGTNHRPAYGVTSCDLDNDGAPELMVTAYGRQWSMLYANDGSGRYAEVGQPAGFAGDANVDYSDNQNFLCACKSGLSDSKCPTNPQPAITCAANSWQNGVDDQPWRNNGNGFTTLCSDLDGDGKLDLYTAGIHHWWAGGSGDSSELVRNIGAQPGEMKFDRPGNAATGMVWPHKTQDWNEGGLMAAAGDFDGDGREDLIVAASDYPDQFGLLFHQKADHTYEEVGKAWGIHHACVSGVTVADFDRDGDLDIIVGSGTARDCSKTWKKNEVHIYENQGTQAQFLSLRLVGDGVSANKGGIGARITVKAGGETLVKELDGGYGHFGMQNDAGIVFFGLGACAKIESVTVRWPNAAGTTEVWKAVDAGFAELHQGDTKVYRRTTAK